MNALRLTLKILLPLIVLALGGLASWWIVTNKAQPIVREPDVPAPQVRVVTVETSAEPLTVRAQGAVEPLRTVELAAEVGGRIVTTHDALRAGGTFTPNDVLVQIDTTDFELAITQQESAVARAELRLLQEKAEGEAAVRAWRQLEGDRPSDPLVRREPQIRDAELALAAAEAQLTRARNDLLRTKVQLPFTGRVRSVHADIGQTVQRGQRLAVVIDTTEVEVRLPIPLADAAFLDLPLRETNAKGPNVKLRAQFAGKRQTWHGNIVRTDGEVDRRTRQLTVIARMREGDNDGTPPLLVGMFVDAEITGRTVANVTTLPRGALAGRDHVWVVAPKLVRYDGWLPQFATRLQKRPVSVLRSERDRVLIDGGLQTGERVMISNLDTPIDGMAVRIRPAASGSEGAR